MTEGQIGILVSTAAILAVAGALWRKQALNVVPLVIALVCALGVAGLLVLSF